MTSKNDLKTPPTQYLEEAANLPSTIVSHVNRQIKF